MSEHKVKWQVDPAPTGRYRSFETRAWPSGLIKDEYVAALYCDTEYNGPNSRRTDLLIRVRVTDRRFKKWEWRTLAKRASSIAEAKLLVSEFFKANPTWLGELE